MTALSKPLSSSLAQQKGGCPYTAVRTLLRSVAKRSPQLEPGSGRSSVALLAAVVGSALLLGERKRREQKGKDEERKVVDHPLVAWLAENGWVLAIASLVNALVPAPKPKSFGSAVRSQALGSTLVVCLCMAGMTLYTNKVYSHLPWFGEKQRPMQSLSHHLSEWLRCNLFVEAFNAVAFGLQAVSLSLKAFHHSYVERKLNPVRTLMKFAVMRACVDMGFWVGHRILHTPQFYWIHRRHHEHFRPGVHTNVHFHPLDLFVEAIFLLMLGLTALETLKMHLVRFEMLVISTYIFWHESGSHSGKALPMVSYFPPLAPLYQLVLGDVDAENVKHHDVHHARLNCNYSIVIWPDMLMGTRLRDHKDQRPGKSA